MGDAIGRTLFRLFVSRRNLLQWVTAAQANCGPGSISRRLSPHGGGVAIALTAAVAHRVFAARRLVAGAPFVLLWIASPAIAVWISRLAAIAGRLGDHGRRRQRPATDRAAHLALISRPS